MAGRKVFTSGEILTAADVNSFLMDQSVMVFADSTARSSAIPTPSEGMVTFREDQDVVEVYDGSAFKTVGGLVAVKSALKTDTFSASVGGAGNVAVTDLSITHEVSDPANKLVISAFFGNAANNLANRETAVGIAIANDGSLINIASSPGSRIAVSSGGLNDLGGTGNTEVVTMPHISFVYSPGDTSSHTYTVRAINTRGTTQTLYINRSGNDTNANFLTRAVSSIVIQEVAV